MGGDLLNSEEKYFIAGADQWASPLLDTGRVAHLLMCAGVVVQVLRRIETVQSAQDMLLV